MQLLHPCGQREAATKQRPFPCVQRSVGQRSPCVRCAVEPVKRRSQGVRCAIQPLTRCSLTAQGVLAPARRQRPCAVMPSLQARCESRLPRAWVPLPLPPTSNLYWQTKALLPAL